MRSSQIPDQSRSAHSHSLTRRTCICLLCLLLFLLAACDSSGTTTRKTGTVQTDSGSTIVYSMLPQDVLVRSFYGGGKVGILETTPEVSLYGNGTFILGPGLNLQQGSLSIDTHQNLLHTLTSTDNLLLLHTRVFNDVPDQNTTLLQVNLNNKNYQFVYGPFGNLQESSQDMHDYQQLGNAIAAVKNALGGPKTSYTSQKMALLVYQTSRLDYTQQHLSTIATWPINDINLYNAAANECGSTDPDPNNPRPNLDNGCLTYTVPQVAFLPSKQDITTITHLLGNQQSDMFSANNNLYVVTLRPLLPDELSQKKLAMYGSGIQDYSPIPLKEGAIPEITPTP